MKKLFTLLTLAVLSIGSAWAADEIIFSANPTEAWSVPASTTDAEITSTYATITGGKMYLTNPQSSAKDMLKMQGEYAFQHTNNDTFFKVVLDKALEAGDVISARMQSRTDTDLGLWFSTATSRPGTEPTSKIVLATASSQAWVAAPTYTVATGDGICGETTFYIYRHTGKGTYFNTFVITRPESRTPSTLTFAETSGSVDIVSATTYTLPTLTKNPTDATVTYSSSNTSVAKVDATTGAITLVAAGTAVITASYAGNDTYAPASAEFTLTVINSAVVINTVGYTEAINDTKLDARLLTGTTNVTISDPIFGSAINNYSGTGKKVYIDNTEYTNTDSWRKSVNAYDNQNVGYTLTVASGYKMNIKKVNARIAVADDTYTWYVNIVNGAGTEIWKSGERTTTKASSGKIDNVDVSDKTAIQGLTGTVTVNLWVKQGGNTKYFSINYLQLDVETEVDDRPTYAMSVSQNPAEAGSVTPADGSEVTEGESVAFTATPNTDYKFVKWTIDGTDQTTNPYTIDNVTATHTAVATFAKRFKVSYELGEYAGTITDKVLCNVSRDNGIDEIYSDDADNYTIPTYADKYLYKEGYVFDKWQDGDGNTYASGDVIAMTKDITLTPTWKETTESLSLSGSSTVVTWSFAKAAIPFFDWQSDDKYGYSTQTATVNGEAIAVPMTITKGKVANFTRTDAIAQTNQNTTFTIPAVSGMVVEIADANTVFSTTTIAEATDYKGTGTKSISYTYKGDAETIDIVIGESNQYLKTIKVTYPATPATIAITSAGWATFSCTKEVAIPEGVTAYVVSKKGEGTVTLSEIEGNIPAKTGVVVSGDAGNYDANITNTGASISTTNYLVAWTTAGEPTDATYYTLAVDGNGPLFKQSSGGILAAGKAYLVLPESSGESRLSIDFDGGVTTIAAPTAIADMEAGKAEVYNLQGQRVSTPTKGLYIVGGKKVMKK